MHSGGGARGWKEKRNKDPETFTHATKGWAKPCQKSQKAGEGWGRACVVDGWSLLEHPARLSADGATCQRVLVLPSPQQKAVSIFCLKTCFGMEVCTPKHTKSGDEQFPESTACSHQVSWPGLNSQVMPPSQRTTSALPENADHEQSCCTGSWGPDIPPNHSSEGFLLQISPSLVPWTKCPYRSRIV